MILNGTITPTKHKMSSSAMSSWKYFSTLISYLFSPLTASCTKFLPTIMPASSSCKNIFATNPSASSYFIIVFSINLSYFPPCKNVSLGDHQHLPRAHHFLPISRFFKTNTDYFYCTVITTKSYSYSCTYFPTNIAACIKHI